MKGIYIAFEGIEGCGKTTLAHMTYRWLKESGIDTILTREPGGTLVGAKLREIVLNESVSPFCELFLYLADRAEHTEKILKSALSSGKWVVSDRCFLSTLAYQGYGRKLMDIEKLKDLNAVAIQNIAPHIIFVIDIDPAISLKRLNKKDRIESEDLDFHKRVRRGYLELSKGLPNCKVLNGKLKPEQLFETVKKEFKKYLG